MGLLWAPVASSFTLGAGWPVSVILLRDYDLFMALGIRDELYESFLNEVLHNKFLNKV